MPKADILFVGFLPTPPPTGGMEIIIADVLSKLASRGYSVHGLAPQSTLRETPHATQVCSDHPFPMTRYPIAGIAHQPTSPDQFALHRRQISRFLPSLIAEQCPDVILVGHPAYVGSVSALAHERGVPWAVWIHSPLQPMVFGDGRVPQMLAETILGEIRKADAVISVARHVAIDSTGVGLTALEVVPNGIDLSYFCPGEPDQGLANAIGVRRDDVVALHVSNLRTVKRGLDLVHSASQALPHNPHLRYLIVGDGPDRGGVEQACRQHGLQDRFHFSGWVDRNSIADYLRLADVVLMPSASEGLSLAYLEAQAAAKPLIASDIAAAREVIDDGVTGVLFPPGDIAALTRRTLELAGDWRRRGKIGAAARRFAEQHHDIETTVDRLEAVIQRTIARAAA